jgi:hypothetical protein
LKTPIDKKTNHSMGRVRTDREYFLEPEKARYKR